MDTLCRSITRISTVLVALGALLVLAASPAVYAEDIQVQSASALGNRDPERSETAIGNLVTDAVRRELRTDVAFIAASEMKPKDPPFPAGKISSNEIAGLISYSDDPLAVLQLTGKAIRQAIERSVSIYPQPNLGFLHVSGLRYTIDPERPAGSRVTSILVGSGPVVDDATYTVAMTNSMANGALGYWKVWNESQIKERRPGTSIPGAIESYFRANPRIDYSNLDRLSTAR